MREELEEILEEVNKAIESCRENKELIVVLTSLLKFKLEIIEKLSTK